MRRLYAKNRKEKRKFIRTPGWIRIVEYGVFHAGPGAKAILGDLGADIIKIETFSGDPDDTGPR